MGKVVLLNAPVMKPGLVALCGEASLEDALAAAGRAESYIGHPATAKVLGVAPNRGEYNPADGDMAFVVRLRRRQAAPGDVEVTPEDLEVLRVKYIAISRLHAAATWGRPDEVDYLLG